MNGKALMIGLALPCFSLFAPAVQPAQFDVELNLKETSGPSRWEFAGWYAGGCYPGAEFDPNVNGRMYLVSDVAGIWRSDDLAESWRFVNAGLDNLNVSAIAIAPSDSNVLYAATQGGVFVSRNAGMQWSAANALNGGISFKRPQSHRPIAVAQNDSATLVAGAANGSVYYSKDQGRNWSALGNVVRPFGGSSPITAVAISADGGAVWAGSQEGVARYSAAQDRWTRLSGPESAHDLVLQDGRLYVAGGSSLFISDDGGDRWSRSSPIPSGAVSRVAASADGSFLAVAWERGWEGGVFLSEDGGRTWFSGDRLEPNETADPARSWMKPGGRVTALRIHPGNRNILFRTDWWSAWRSDNGGLLWRERILGAPNSVDSDVVADPRGNLYVAALDNGLLKSNDRGRTYYTVFPTSNRDDSSGHVWRVAVSADATRVVATSSPWNEDINQVLVSDDGGETFEIVRSGLPRRRPRANTLWEAGYPRALAANPADFNQLYLGIDGDDGGGLYISRDGGRNWSAAPGQPGSRRIYNALAVDPTRPSRLYWGACGPNGGIYRSEDGGTTWQHVFSQMSCVFDCKVASDGAVFAAGDLNGPTVFMSDAGGANWRPLRRFAARGTAEGLAVHPTDPAVIAVSSHRWDHSSSGRVYLSRDRGRSWEDITGDLPQGPGAAALAFNRSDACLYLARYAGSVYRRRI